MRCSSTIEEVEGGKPYIILFLNEKVKGTKYERNERYNIVCKLLK